MTQALALRAGEIAKPVDGPGQDRWGALMSAARAGNARAYDELLREVSAWLRRYYARRLPSPMIEDVVQEALLGVHLKRDTYQVGRPFRAWLAGIARYKGVDGMRSARRDLSEPLEGRDFAIPDHGPAVASRLCLEALLATIKPAQARAIFLVKIEGYCVEEAAAATGQSVSLVKVNIHRGITTLTTQFGS